jgi:hypothetical protein
MEEKWRRLTNWGYNTYKHGNTTRKLPVYLTQVKNVIFFSFFCFSSIKYENRRVEQVLPKEVGGREVVVGKGYRRVVQILSTHVCKYKNDTC